MSRRPPACCGTGSRGDSSSSLSRPRPVRVGTGSTTAGRPGPPPGGPPPGAEARAGIGSAGDSYCPGTHSRPTPAQVARALVRAERGVALDAAEARRCCTPAALGDGEPLDRLLTAAGGCATRGWPRPGRPGVVTYSRKVFIPLTHLCRDRCHYCTFVTDPRPAARARARRRSSPPTRCSTSPAPGAALGCKEALFTLGDRPEDRWPVAAEWLDGARLRLDAGLPAGDGDPGAGGDRAAAAPQPRRADLGGDPAAQAGVGVDGHDAGDDGDPAVVRAGRPALRLARTRSPPSGCGCSRTPAAPPSRSPPACCWASARTTPSGSTPILQIRAVGAAARARAGGDRPELPGQAAHGDAGARRPGAAGVRRRRRRRPGCCSARRRGCRRRRTCPTPPSSACCCAPASTTGAGSRPLTPDHVNPERPWPNIDKLAALTAEAGFDAARAAGRPAAVRARSPSRGWTRGCARTSPRWPAPTGWPSRAAIPVGLPWQEPRRVLRGRRLGSGRTDLHVEVDTVGRTARPAQRLRRRLRRLGRAARAHDAARDGHSHRPGRRRPRGAGRAAGTPSRPGRALRRRVPGRLLGADGPTWRRWPRWPTPSARRHRRRRHLRRQPEHQLHQRLLHRLPVLRVRPAAHRRRRLHAVDGTRSATGSTRRGRPGRPRSACRAASTPTCPAPPTSTWPAR